MWAKHKQSEIQMVREIAQGPSRNKLTVNLSWFQLCEPNIYNLKSKWSREIEQAQDHPIAFIDGENNLLSEIIKKLL